MMTNTNLPVSSVSPSGGFLTSVLLSVECRSDAVRTTLEESVVAAVVTVVPVMRLAL